MKAVTFGFTYPLNSPLNKRKETVCRFWIFMSKKQILTLKFCVFRKPTFTGQYLRREFFSPLKRKISLISTLVHRALIICIKSRLNEEIELIKKISLDNGYSKNVINAQIAKKV